MSQVISIQEASSILPELIKRATSGESILIGNDGQAEVSLHAIKNKKQRKIGLLSDKQLNMADDFDAPLSPENFSALDINK